MDPPRRMRLHSSSFSLFRRVARGGGGGGGAVHELYWVLTTFSILEGIYMLNEAPVGTR